METIELKDGGLLLYDDSFLSSALADRYFMELRDHCQWEQKPGIFGYMQPRLIASYGDVGVSYRYSGMNYAALPWTATLLENSCDWLETPRPTPPHGSMEAHYGKSDSGLPQAGYSRMKARASLFASYSYNSKFTQEGEFNQT